MSAEINTTLNVFRKSLFVVLRTMAQEQPISVLINCSKVLSFGDILLNTFSTADHTCRKGTLLIHLGVWYGCFQKYHSIDIPMLCVRGGKDKGC